MRFLDRLNIILLEIALTISPTLSLAQSVLLPGFPPGVFQSRAAIDATPAGGCSDTNATAWVNAVVTAGGTVSGAQQTRVCNLIVALKGHSLFAKLDRMWLYASENAFQAQIDIVNLATHTVSGAPTFTASQGYTGNGSAFINTNFIPSSSGSTYTLNSASIGLYVRNNRTTTAAVEDMGALDGTSNETAIQPFAFNFNILKINTTSSILVGSPTTAQGFWMGSRTASNLESFYYNGNTTPIGTDAVADSARPTVAIYVLARNSSGTADQISSDQVAVSFLGGALTSTDIANMSSDVNGGYMTALGTNVY